MRKRGRENTSCLQFQVSINAWKSVLQVKLQDFVNVPLHDISNTLIRYFKYVVALYFVRNLIYILVYFLIKLCIMIIRIINNNNKKKIGNENKNCYIGNK